MRKRKLTPNIYSYNLLLKATKDCGLGDIAFANELIPQRNKQFVPTLIDATPHHQTDSLKETNDSELIPLHHVDQAETFLDLEYKPDILDIRSNYQNVVSLGEIVTPSDRLALLGGMDNFLSLMTKDNVKPDIKTFTQLIDVIPSTRECEEQLLDNLREYKVVPDVDFFNILIKKRNFRNDFSGSKNILAMIRDYRLYPNVLTFGCLALGCRSRSDALQLIKDMELIGFAPNVEIMGTLAKEATLKPNFWFLIDICKETKRLQIQPDEKFLHHIENCLQKTRKMINLIQSKSRSDKKSFDDEYDDDILENKASRPKEFLKEPSQSVDDKTALYTDERFLKSFAVFQKYYKGWLQSTNIPESKHPWSEFRNPIKKVNSQSE